MRKIISSLTAICLLAASAAAISLNVDPSSLALSAAPGESVSGTVIVDNKGASEIAVRAYTEDWTFLPDRSKAFRKPGSAKYSCSEWITLSPDNFSLPAGKSQEVRYTLTVPAEASGGRYSVIFFESQQDDPDLLRKANVIIAGRIGTIVYFETKGDSEKKISVHDLKVSKPVKDRPMYFKVTVNNEGNTYLDPSGSFMIVDDLANLYARIDIPKTYVLQGESSVLERTWISTLPAGDYDVIATLDFGGEAPVSMKKRITVPN